MNKPLVGVAAIIVLIAALSWYLLHTRTAAVPSVPPAVTNAVPAPPEEPGIAHPLPASGADATAEPLPALAESDQPLQDALAKLVGAEAVMNYLRGDGLVRRLVVTVDNLPRQKVPVDKRPTVSPSGAFLVQGDELHATLDSRNFERYKPMVEVIRALDVQQLARLYIRFYPLLQQSYQDLGYPSGYFNDRLVQVIDVLLATPQPAGPVELVRPNVMYMFADPALEARPAGQKLLLRMGADNAAILKAKLTELRSAITAAAPKR